MPELQLDRAELKIVKGHRYYVFPSPSPHSNYKDRPTKEYAEPNVMKPYRGKGTNHAAELHPDVLEPVNTFMTALLEYGEKIDDWSIRSAVVHNGWRTPNATQGTRFLRVAKLIISRHGGHFPPFPSDLEEEATSVLGAPGDPRRKAFQKKLAESEGWTQKLADEYFYELYRTYPPRGSNPHATGFVFDLDFWTYWQGKERRDCKCTEGELELGADTQNNAIALKSAAGMWINQFAMQYGFDSYDTSIEVWHMEYRNKK